MAAKAVTGGVGPEGQPASARVSSSLLGAMQAFDAAVRLGSFKAAAESLSLTSSAVSHRISKLEARLGERLFERHNRRIQPTPAGDALAIMTGRAFAELARALDRGASPASRSTLKLSVFPLFGSAWLLPRLADFIAEHPAVELSISMSTQPVDLETGPFDAVVRSGSGDWPGLTALPLMQLFTTALASPQLAATLGGDLAKAPLIQMTRFPGAWSPWLPDQDLARRPAKTVWVEGFEAAMLAAERGAGVALGLYPLCRPSLDAGHLVEVSPPRLETSKAWLAHRTSDAGHPPLTAFKTWLRKALAAEA